MVFYLRAVSVFIRVQSKRAFFLFQLLSYPTRQSRIADFAPPCAIQRRRQTACRNRKCKICTIVRKRDVTRKTGSRKIYSIVRRQRRSEPRPQVACTENCVRFGHVLFGRTFVKRFTLCYRTVVCHVCLFVTLVHCG